jgi:hypothetical protein
VLLNSSPTDGFDPARFYLNVRNSIVLGYDFYSNNYQGVLYLYKGVMMALGVDPMAPLFFNALLSLFALANISSTFFQVDYPSFREITKYIPFLLFIPEIIAYTVMSSREVFCASMSLIFVSYLIRYCLFNRSRYLLFCMASAFLIFVIRPPFGLLSFICLGFILFMNAETNKDYYKYIIVISLVFLLIAFGGILNLNINSASDVDMSHISGMLLSKVSDNNSKAEYMIYSDSSIAGLLIPHNPLEFILFGIIRSTAYIIPSAFFMPGFSFTSLANLSSYIFCVFLPIIWKVIYSFKSQNHIMKIIIIYLIIYILVIGFSNTNMIHIRYRIAYDFVYFIFALVGIQELGGWKCYGYYFIRFWAKFSPIILMALLFYLYLKY